MGHSLQLETEYGGAAMDIQNKTRRPLRIPLPGGKKLHLGPGKTGQITPKAGEHPPIKKLIDEGELEVVGEGKSIGTGGSSGGSGSSGGTGVNPTQGGPATGGVRHTGDR